MIPIVDKPVIQYRRRSPAGGIEEILIITGHGKRAIEDHFDTTNIDLNCSCQQKDRLLRMVQDISGINVHIRQSICAASATPSAVPNRLYRQ